CPVWRNDHHLVWRRQQVVIPASPSPFVLRKPGLLSQLPIILWEETVFPIGVVVPAIAIILVVVFVAVRDNAKHVTFNGEAFFAYMYINSVTIIKLIDIMIRYFGIYNIFFLIIP